MGHSRFFRHPLAVAVAMALSGATQAAVITVDSDQDNTTDDSLCTLREAVQAANTDMAVDTCAAGSGSDTIGFNLPVGSTITLGLGELAVSGDESSEDLTIVGPQAGNPSSITIDANNASRIFRVDTYFSSFGSYTPLLTLENITLSNGSASADGGAVRSAGSLVLNDAVVRDSQADNGDGGGHGGGVYAQFDIALTRSTVSGNFAGGNGGGLYSFSGNISLANSTVSSNSAAYYGGGSYAYGDISLTDSTVSGNSAAVADGGLFAYNNITLNQSTVSGNYAASAQGHGGGLHAFGDISLTDSTVSGNSTGGDGGGLVAYGNMALNQSTVSGNSAGGKGGGGLLVRGGTLIQSTVVSNTAGGGAGGLHSSQPIIIEGASQVAPRTTHRMLIKNVNKKNVNKVAPRTTHSVLIENSVLAANTGPEGNFYDLDAVAVNVSHSVFGDAPAEITGANTNNIFSDAPGLGALQDNGGPTETHLPGASSPVIDAGDNAAAPDSVDQRGTGFPRIVNGTVDIGSVEYNDFQLTLTIIPASISENGGLATGTVSRNAGANELTVTLSSDDTTEATVPASVTIPANAPSADFTVTAVDDALLDGTQTVTVSATATDFASAVDTVEVTDDETADFTVTESGGDTVVSENGSSDTLEVVLTAQPLADVVIAVDSSDTGEAGVAPPTLTFTSGNWDAPQTVTVTGVDDALLDGDQDSVLSFQVVDAQSDDGFDGLSKTVTATTLDDETAGFTVTESGGGTVVSEFGTSDTVQVVLTQQPNSDVVIDVSSADPGEATVSPDRLTFTSSDWDTPQTVTVTGVDDDQDDGDQSTLLTFAVDDAASDDFFDGLSNIVAAVTLDDEGLGIEPTPGITVVPTRLITSESGTSAAFSVKLNTLPTADVTIDLSSSDPSEGTLDVTQLTFTPGNATTPQTVIVTGVDDQEIDGDVDYQIVTQAAQSADPDYAAEPSSDVQVTNLDNELGGDGDGDNIPDEVEDEAPNDGDGNGDGVDDSEQPHVTSLPDLTGESYISIELTNTGECDQIDSVTVLAESEVAEDAEYDYPLGVFRLVLACSDSADIVLYLHGLSSVAEAYRIFDGVAWDKLPGAEFGQTSIAEKTVITVSFTLLDGGLGDLSDSGDERIDSISGPAVRQAPAPVPIPTLSQTAQLLAVLLLGLLGLGGRRKLKQFS